MNRRSRALQSVKSLRKKRRKVIVIASLSVICLFVFLSTVVFILRLPFFQISSIEIKGVTTLNIKEIEQKVSANLLGNYLWTIPKSNSLFYPKGSIEKVLSESYKQIEKININRKGISNIEVNVIERVPTALVCEGFHEDNNNDENCFFVDSYGFVFAKSPQFSNNVFLHYYIVTDKGDDIIGSEFIDQNRFMELQKFVSNVTKSGISPNGMLISDNGAYELYVKNRDNTEAIIYFDDRVPFDKTSSNLITFWSNSLIKKKGVATTPIFDYINLRFGNNIFYVTK